jgi:hypothetical protein
MTPLPTAVNTHCYRRDGARRSVSVTGWNSLATFGCQNCHLRLKHSSIFDYRILEEVSFHFFQVLDWTAGSPRVSGKQTYVQRVGGMATEDAREGMG